MARSTYHVHPSVGLTPVHEVSLEVRAVVPWTEREDESELEAEQRFLTAAIAFFAVEGATFEAGVTYEAEVADLAEAARAAGVEVVGDLRNGLKGPLVPALAAEFPAHTQLVLTVWVNDAEQLYVHDDVDEVYVHLDQDEVEPFLSALAEAGFTLERQPPYEPPPVDSPDSPWRDGRLRVQRLRRWRADGTEVE